MRIRELLEAFDAPLPYTWSEQPAIPKAHDGYTSAVFTDPLGRPGQVNFYRTKRPDGSTAVDVAFFIDGQADRQPAKGNERKIFSTVINSIRDYLTKTKPEIITFSADESNRARLYKKMLQRELSAFPGYTNRSTVNDLGGGFMLTKSDYMKTTPKPVSLIDPTEPFTPRHPDTTKQSQPKPSGGSSKLPLPSIPFSPSGGGGRNMHDNNPFKIPFS